MSLAVRAARLTVPPAQLLAKEETARATFLGCQLVAAVAAMQGFHKKDVVTSGEESRSLERASPFPSDASPWACVNEPRQVP